ncbi:MAG: metallophosphoesterase [Nitrospirae bacterium]|nr:metallophosphoesterase [Nitrospirota bacterium]
MLLLCKRNISGLRSLRTMFGLAALLLVLASVISCGGSSADPSWRFAYMSDNKWDKKTSEADYVNVEAVKRLSGDMVKQGVSLVIVGGDLIDGRGEGVSGLNAQYATWLDAMSAVYRAGVPVYAVPGNHEYWCDTNDSCIAAWNQTMAPTFPASRTDNPAFPGMEYSFIFNNAFFIGLNQNRFADTFPEYYRGNDVDWIAGQLAARDPSAQPHIITFGHMPQFMTKWEWTRPEDKSNREAFWSLLGNAGARMYFTGHSHLYAVGLASTEDGRYFLYQVISGSGGAEAEKSGWDGLYAEDTRVQPVDWDEGIYREGYALVTITGRDVTLEWRYYDDTERVFKTKPVFSYSQ